MGTWAVREDQLYLAEIRMRDGMPWGKVINAEERELGDALDEPNKCQVTPETLFPGQSLPIFASWFTGILRLVQGDVIDYVHGGYESTYEREFLLRVENGMVIGDTVNATCRRQLKL